MTLEGVLNASISDFFQLGQVAETRDGPYIYIDRGANILAVAHLDTVQDGTPKPLYINIKGQRFVYHPKLDDRLGAWVILELLPKLGVHCDVLLTTGEEIGCSTAQYFEPPSKKEYLWMFEFDRGGTDAVCYHYETAELIDRLRNVGYAVGVGSYTDISKLDHLGVQGVNFAVCYYNYHAKNAYANLTQLRASVNKFLKFYELYKDVHMPFDLEAYEDRYSYLDRDHYGSFGWDDWSYNTRPVWSGQIRPSYYYDDSEADYEDDDEITDLDRQYAAIIASTVANRQLPPGDWRVDDHDDKIDNDDGGGKSILSRPHTFWRKYGSRINDDNEYDEV